MKRSYSSYLAEAEAKEDSYQLSQEIIMPGKTLFLEDSLTYHWTLFLRHICKQFEETCLWMETQKVPETS